MSGNSNHGSDPLRELIIQKAKTIDGDFSHIARDIPRIYDYLVSLLDDDKLPDEYRPFIMGSFGMICLPKTVLPDPDRNALAIAYLVSSISRKLAESDETRHLLTEHWPAESDSVESELSAYIRQGNESLTNDEIVEVFEYAGFQTKGM